MSLGYLCFKSWLREIAPSSSRSHELLLMACGLGYVTSPWLTLTLWETLLAQVALIAVIPAFGLLISKSLDRKSFGPLAGTAASVAWAATGALVLTLAPHAAISLPWMAPALASCLIVTAVARRYPWQRWVLTGLTTVLTYLLLNAFWVLLLLDSAAVSRGLSSVDLEGTLIGVDTWAPFINAFWLIQGQPPYTFIQEYYPDLGMALAPANTLFILLGVSLTIVLFVGVVRARRSGPKVLLGLVTLLALLSAPATIPGGQEAFKWVIGNVPYALLWRSSYNKLSLSLVLVLFSLVYLTLVHTRRRTMAMGQPHLAMLVASGVVLGSLPLLSGVFLEQRYPRDSILETRGIGEIDSELDTIVGKIAQSDTYETSRVLNLPLTESGYVTLGTSHGGDYVGISPYVMLGNGSDLTALGGVTSFGAESELLERSLHLEDVDALRQVLGGYAIRWIIVNRLATDPVSSGASTPFADHVGGPVAKARRVASALGGELRFRGQSLELWELPAGGDRVTLYGLESWTSYPVVWTAPRADEVRASISVSDGLAELTFSEPYAPQWTLTFQDCTECTVVSHRASREANQTWTIDLGWRGGSRFLNPPLDITIKFVSRTAEWSRLLSLISVALLGTMGVITLAVWACRGVRSRWSTRQGS